jgi:hypothetical protein
MSGHTFLEVCRVAGQPAHGLKGESQPLAAGGNPVGHLGMGGLDLPGDGYGSAELVDRLFISGHAMGGVAGVEHSVAQFQVGRDIQRCRRLAIHHQIRRSILPQTPRRLERGLEQRRSFEGGVEQEFDSLPAVGRE